MIQMTPEEGARCRQDIFESNRRLCDKEGATHEELIKRLNRLSKIRIRKEHYDLKSQTWTYSKPLVVPNVQFQATMALLEITGRRPAQRQEHTFPEGPPISITTISPERQQAYKEAEEAYARALL
jgi:hypothetical protein